MPLEYGKHRNWGLNRVIWYYAENAEEIGPLAEAEFTALVQAGAIREDTEVWGEGMPTWLPYSQAAGQFTELPPPSAPEEGTSSCVCAFCGKLHELEDVIQYSGKWICAGCKPEFVQRLREGMPLPGVVEYAGFGLRLRAKILDGMIIFLLAILLYIAAIFVLDPSLQPGSQSERVLVTMLYILPALLSIVYTTYFLGAYGATPGKMIAKLRVLRGNGERVTYRRAFYRHLAEFLSYIPLLLGYVIALFDGEHRTLHDRICDTRVVVRKEES